MAEVSFWRPLKTIVSCDFSHPCPYLENLGMRLNTTKKLSSKNTPPNYSTLILFPPHNHTPCFQEPTVQVVYIQCVHELAPPGSALGASDSLEVVLGQLARQVKEGHGHRLRLPLEAQHRAETAMKQGKQSLGGHSK